MWIFAMATAPGSENPFLATLHISLSLPGSALCLGWNFQPSTYPGRVLSFSLGICRVVSKTLLFWLLHYTQWCTATSLIFPAWIILLLFNRHLGPTFIFKLLSLLCRLRWPLLYVSLLSGQNHPLQLQTSGIIFNIYASPQTVCLKSQLRT